MVREDDPGTALYIVVSGQAVLAVTDNYGQEQEMLLLKAGEFFGEMALFSSKPSVVSVTAIEDLEGMMISLTIVNQMIERQPSFAREIGQILETRRRAIQAVKQREQPSNLPLNMM